MECIVIAKAKEKVQQRQGKRIQIQKTGVKFKCPLKKKSFKEKEKANSVTKGSESATDLFHRLV